MYFVYFLRSESNSDKTYIGQTANLERRLSEHNSDTRRSYTSQYRPWKVEAFVIADTREIAEKAERYFKSPSGKEKFQRFAEANPNHSNPIEGFFASQREGRTFGRSNFKIKNAHTAVLTEC